MCKWCVTAGKGDGGAHVSPGVILPELSSAGMTSLFLAMTVDVVLTTVIFLHNKL